MNSLETGILALLRSGLTDTPCQIEPGADWEKIFQIAGYHGVISLVYRAIRVSGLEVPKDALIRFRAGFTEDIRASRFQMSELKSLFDVFEENGIDYLPLKGVIMKPLYPSPEYRWMSDADIIIRESQYDAIKKIMKQSGFSFEHSTAYDQIWEKSGFFIELHNAALSDKTKKSANYFGNIFSNAVHDGASRFYRMTANDEIIYNISHLAKHYISGGTRLRSLLDFYYLFRKKDMDEDKLIRSLDDLKLRYFYNIVKRTIDCWFGGKPFDGECELLLANAFSESGSYMLSRAFTYRVAHASHGDAKAGKTGRAKTVGKRILPPYRLMLIRYPILKKLPFLLPFLWVWRWISTLLFHRKNLEEVMRIGVFDSENTVNEYMDELKAMGLDSTILPEEL